MSLLRWLRVLIASLIFLFIHSLSFVVAFTLPMFTFAALSMASFRYTILASNEAVAMWSGVVITETSTSLEKPSKSALAQLHRSSVIGGGFIVDRGQSTVIIIGRWSEPMHSTVSSQQLLTIVTSGALRPPVPALTLIAEPSFTIPKSLSAIQSSRFAPISSSGCH